MREIEINLDDAIGVEVMLSRTNDDLALRKAYDQTVEAYGCNIIRHTLLIQLAMALVRMHDPGTGNKASLPHLFELLSDRGVVAEFRQDARGWHHDLAGLDDSSEQTVVDAIRGARSKWQEIKKGKPIERLRVHRHRYIAHTLIEMPETERAVCNDIFKLLNDTTPIVEKLLLGLLGRAVDFDDIRRIRCKHADAFWSSAVAGVSANRTL